MKKTVETKPKKANSSEYDAKSIQQLPFPDNVRTRPQIYLGDLEDESGSGSLTCLREIVNNSVDEHLRGFCDKINVVSYGNGEYMVTDNGRGVPFGAHDSGKNALEVIFGELHSGRNFDPDKKEYTTGLNGVGSSAVNAVSEFFSVTAKRDKKQGVITFDRGRVKSLELGEAKVTKGGYKSGTKVHFKLDETLFKAGFIGDEVIYEFLRETAFLNNGLEVTFKPAEEKDVYTFKYENGVEEFLKEFYDPKKAVTPVICASGTDKGNKIEAAFMWTADFKPEEIHSFCNTIRTGEGGTHVTGLKRAISQHVVDYIRTNKLVKETIENDDVYGGLVAIVSSFVYHPRYSTQTKQKLTNTDVGGSSLSIVTQGLKDWMERNGKAMKVLAERIAVNARVRMASKRAVDSVKKESGSFLSSLNSISKFSDCSGKKDDDCEMFIVEGSSAAGTVIDGRDKATQAVFELKGKMLNVLNTRMEKVHANKEIADLISVMKCGILENCDPEKTKYNRIIILADADDDGFHIKLLAATDYLSLMTPLVEAGMLYFAIPPLYRLTANGKKPIYLRTTQDLDDFFFDEVKRAYTFRINGKEVKKEETHKKTFHRLMEYSRRLEAFAGRLRMKPEAVEIALLQHFDPEEFSFDFGANSKKIKFEFDEEDGTVSIIGFHRDESGRESFVAIVKEDAESFFADMTTIFSDHYAPIVTEVEMVRTDGKELDQSMCLYELIESVTSSLKKTWQVIRFKG